MTAVDLARPRRYQEGRTKPPKRGWSPFLCQNCKNPLRTCSGVRSSRRRGRTHMTVSLIFSLQASVWPGPLIERPPTGSETCLAQSSPRTRIGEAHAIAGWQTEAWVAFRQSARSMLERPWRIPTPGNFGTRCAKTVAFV